VKAGNRVDFRITVANASGARVVRLTGEFDLAGVDLFEDRTNDEGGHETKTTVFDLRDLRFMDSSGLRSLIQAESRLRGAGDRVVVMMGGAGQVAELLSLTGVSARLEIADEIPSELGRSDRG
jgi:anti-anti-sigma factor